MDINCTNIDDTGQNDPFATTMDPDMQASSNSSITDVANKLSTYDDNMFPGSVPTVSTSRPKRRKRVGRRKREHSFARHLIDGSCSSQGVIFGHSPYEVPCLSQGSGVAQECNSLAVSTHEPLPGDTASSKSPASESPSQLRGYAGTHDLTRNLSRPSDWDSASNFLQRLKDPFSTARHQISVSAATNIAPSKSRPNTQWSTAYIGYSPMRQQLPQDLQSTNMVTGPREIAITHPFPISDRSYPAYHQHCGPQSSTYSTIPGSRYPSWPQSRYSTLVEPPRNHPEGRGHPIAPIPGPTSPTSFPNRCSNLTGRSRTHPVGRRHPISRLSYPKKTLNVDSPSFTPTPVASNVTGTTISSRAASAAPFTPRGVASGTATPNLQVEESVSFNPAQIREFTPQSYDLTNSTAINLNGSTIESQVSYDPFTMPTATQTVPPTQYNPYLEDNGNLAGAGTAYYPTQSTYTTSAQPLQYHLYAPIGPHREDLLAYQRPAHDFFMPEKLREDLQKKTEASLQIMPNSQLPALDNYHSLVALDTSHHKSATVFGFPSWIYKAMSSKNGNLYCLRRLEGYRLTNEKAIRSVKEWRRVDNGGVVTVHDAFTTRAFGDSSLIFVTDYHPLSKTLAEHHLSTTNRYTSRPSSVVAEQVLWGYIVQIASAIKSVHTANLAVRCMEPSKVLLTDKNRVRLSACSVLDVVHHDAQRLLQDLQQDDFIHLGKLVLAIATNNLSSYQNVKGAIEQLGRSYTIELRDTVIWLLTPSQPSMTKTIDDLLRGISGHIVTSYDSALHAEDTLTSEITRELENGRIARLMMKLGTINERPEYEGDQNWSEIGERYMLKLFRDYVFHQVDSTGHAVVDLGHIVRCLNKLDVGIDEKVLLMSRDEQTGFVVTYKELKKQVAAAFGDLTKSAKPNRGF